MAPDDLRKRWKRIQQALGLAGTAAWCGSGLWIMYLTPLRPMPDPSSGRVIALPQHGGNVYLSTREDLALNATWIVAAVLLFLVAVIEWKFAPLRGSRR